MFDAYVIEGNTLMVGRPKGILDANTVERIIEFIEIKEVETENPHGERGPRYRNHVARSKGHSTRRRLEISKQFQPEGVQILDALRPHVVRRVCYRVVQLANIGVAQPPAARFSLIGTR